MVDALAEVELLIQDGSVDFGDAAGGQAGMETKRLMLPADRNDRFLDGPATRRIAVVDIDPATGAPLPAPAQFVPAKPSLPTRGSFEYDGNPTSPATIAVNAFGTVFQTVRMFEGPDALGRQVTWAFGSEQLLVVPRAGEWANAFYDRSTRSLQFFWFPSSTGTTVYTALSRDIVAHECGHALLDAVVPSLYDSATPQSIAIHEAVADLIAVLMALDSGSLRTAVLKRSGNSLAGPNAFSGIAEEFGMARPGPGGVARLALRELHNQATLEDLANEQPHVLSTLLSAIFYETLASIFTVRHTAELDASEHDRESEVSPAAAANKALGTAHVIFRRLLLRAIDYLPPGELSFADVGRAALAADRATLPDADASETLRQQRRDFAQRFVRRLVVPAAEDLDSGRPSELDVPPTQIPQLHANDWVAYEYVTKHRDLLGIPAGSPFTVLPRIDATKVIGPERDGVVPKQRELIMKVAWDHLEDSSADVRGAQRRHLPTGATISLRWEDGRCLALVTSDVTGEQHRNARDALLLRLDEDGLLDAGDADASARVGIRVADGAATLSSTHRLLHLAGWER
ncbi:MAG: hypothetical protein ACRDOY_02240 [Nocardioidaceae bacterium]